MDRVEVQRLRRTGNSRIVTVSRPLLQKLGWLLGDPIVAEVRGRSLVVTHLQDHPLAVGGFRSISEDGRSRAARV